LDFVPSASFHNLPSPLVSQPSLINHLSFHFEVQYIFQMKLSLFKVQNQSKFWQSPLISAPHLNHACENSTGGA